MFFDPIESLFDCLRPSGWSVVLGQEDMLLGQEDIHLGQDDIILSQEHILLGQDNMAVSIL